MDIMVIGIAGGTGSGKTTITKKLVGRKSSKCNTKIMEHFGR